MSIVEFVITDLLSQKVLVGPSIGVPNIRNLYLRLSITSTPIRNATNSELKEEDLMVFCLLEYHMIGAQFRNMIIPVCDLCVTRCPAWSASINAFI